MVEDKWKGTVVMGKASFKVVWKLMVLKNEIKTRTKLVGEREGKEFQSTINEIRDLDDKEGSMGITEAERGRRQELKKTLAKIISVDEAAWQQKSREKWLKNGDRNSKYFHAFASYRRSCNYIPELWFGDSRVRGNSDMREAVRLYFS